MALYNLYYIIIIKMPQPIAFQNACNAQYCWMYLCTGQTVWTGACLHSTLHVTESNQLTLN